MAGWGGDGSAGWMDGHGDCNGAWLRLGPVGEEVSYVSEDGIDVECLNMRRDGGGTYPGNAVTAPNNNALNSAAFADISKCIIN